MKKVDIFYLLLLREMIKKDQGRPDRAKKAQKVFLAKIRAVFEGAALENCPAEDFKNRSPLPRQVQKLTPGSRGTFQK